MSQSLDDRTESEDDYNEYHEENNTTSYRHKSLCYLLPIFYPYSSFKLLWNFFVIVILLFTSVQIPFALAFDLPVTIQNGFRIVLLILDTFLCIDILITFRTAFYDKYDPLRLISCPINIAKEYLKFWFFFDLITSFPFDFIIRPNSEGHANILKLLRLIRVIRIFRIGKVLRILNFSQARSRYSPSSIYKFTICKIAFSMAFIAHLFACLWWAVGNWMIDHYDATWVTEQGLDDHNIALGIKYSTSMYWSVITLFTTGYGDIAAHNVMEQWVAIFCVCAGSCVSAWFIGTFAACMLEGDSIQHTQREAVDKALIFCNHFKFDNELERDIVSHTNYHYHYNYVSSSNDQVMQCLPLHLQNKIKEQLATRRSLTQIDFLKHLSHQVIGNLILKIKSVGCNAGYCLYKKGESAEELYICQGGDSKLIKNNEKHLQNACTVKTGHVVGEYCLSEDKRRYTLLCNSWCEFMVLTKQDIHKCILDYYGETQTDIIWKRMVAILNGKRKRRKVKFKNDEKPDLKHDDIAIYNIPNASMNISEQSLVNDMKNVNIKMDEKDGKEEEEKEEKAVEKAVELTFINRNNNEMELSQMSYQELSGMSPNRHGSNPAIDVSPKKGKKSDCFKTNFFKKKKGNKKLEINNVKEQSAEMKYEASVHSYQKAEQQSEISDSHSTQSMHNDDETEPIFISPMSNQKKNLLLT